MSPARRAAEQLPSRSATPLNARQRAYGLQKRKAAPSFLTASPKDRSSKPAAGDTQDAEAEQNSTDSESERE